MRRLPLVSIITITVFLFVVSRIIVKRTILSEDHRIKQITFSTESVLVYDHPSLYKAIDQSLSGLNYFMLKRFDKTEKENDLKKQFPIIKSLQLSRKATNELFVDVTFYEPTFVFTTPTKSFATYQEYLFDLVTGNLLGDSSIHLTLPDYTASYTTLDGIFYALNEADLARSIATINDTLGIETIGNMFYVPGGGKLRIDYKDKQIWFHLTKDINQQLAKLIDTENNFADFSTLKTLDIGSADDTIIE